MVEVTNGSNFVFAVFLIYIDLTIVHIEELYKIQSFVSHAAANNLIILQKVFFLLNNCIQITLYTKSQDQNMFYKLFTKTHI